MLSVHFDADISDKERRERLYAGDIFIYSPSPGTRELIELAARMLKESFGAFDPRTIHRDKSPEEVADLLAVLKPAFIHHPECKRLLPQILTERGVALDQVYFDVPRMRSAYPSHFLSSGIAYAFHPHRDTWYSAPHCQINWWMPIFPLLADNTMAFYPKHHGTGVANTSDTYNYYEWNATSRLIAAQNVKTDTRQQPKAKEPLDPVRIRFLPPPGGMMLFSGAHLHETVENTTDLARYSIDFRTVHLDDVRDRRGAPNVDSKCTGTTMRDYLRASDLAKLPDELVAMYDDQTATADKILYFGDRMAVTADPDRASKG